MKYLALIILAGALSACADPEIDPLPPPPEVLQPVVVVPPVTQDPQTGAISVPVGEVAGIDAPKIGPVAFDLRRRDNGKTFTIPVGQRFSVSLIGVPTAGYAWRTPNMPPILHLDGQTTGPTHTGQVDGASGAGGPGPHWEVTVFEARTPGTATLVFEQNRAGQVEAWTVTIVAT